MDQTPIGHHVTLDMFDCCCPNILLQQVEWGQKIMNNISRYFNEITRVFHQFRPTGYTGVVVLAESHISIHTWPEKSFISCDLYTCDGRIPEEAIGELISYFEPKHVARNSLRRGILSTAVIA